MVNDVLPAIAGSDKLAALGAPLSLPALQSLPMEVEASIVTAPMETEQLSKTGSNELAALQPPQETPALIAS